MTATKKPEEQPQQATLSPQQIQAAAQAGVQLIRDGAVSVPSDMAMNGTLGAINAIFTSLATATAMLVSPELINELQKKAGEKPTPKPRARKKATPKKAPRKKAPAKKKR